MSKQSESESCDLSQCALAQSIEEPISAENAAHIYVWTHIKGKYNNRQITIWLVCSKGTGVPQSSALNYF